MFQNRLHKKDGQSVTTDSVSCLPFIINNGKPMHIPPIYGIAHIIKSHCFHFISLNLLLAANKPIEKIINMSSASNNEICPD